MKVMPNDPEMLEEYDFSDGVRGKYAKRYVVKRYAKKNVELCQMSPAT